MTSTEESEDGCSDDESDTESSSDISTKQSGMLLLDTSGLQLSVQEAAMCRKCNGELTLSEDFQKQMGLFFHIFFAKKCH